MYIKRSTKSMSKSEIAITAFLVLAFGWFLGSFIAALKLGTL